MSILDLHEVVDKWKNSRIQCKYQLLHSPLYMAVFANKIFRHKKCIVAVFILAFLVFFRLFSSNQFGLIKEKTIIKSSMSFVREDYNTTIQQDDIDHFARNIKISVTVVDNFFDNEKLCQIELLLTNNGVRTFPSSGWEVYFSQPQLLEPNLYPYPKGVGRPQYLVKFFFLMGNVYSMVPTKHFGTIKPGESKLIRYYSRSNSITVSGVHPNWYITSPGLQARVIESTANESFGLLFVYNSLDILEKKGYDQYNLFTAADRYDSLAAGDLGTDINPVIPTPVNMPVYRPMSKVNIRSNHWVVLADSLLVNVAKYLRNEWGIQMVVMPPAAFYIRLLKSDVQVIAQGRQLPVDEAYELKVEPSRQIITIIAAQPAGAFYAVQTLLSLTDHNGDIPETAIKDAPRYPYRGVHIDVARNFQSKEQIYRYLDIMAMYKLNKFHFHLTDDEGWRLAIPGLEELTELGARRCHDPSGTHCLLPFLGSGPLPNTPGSGYYSVEDYKAILRYATARHIEVIPEIEMPGHSHAAIKAMEARYKRLLSLNVTGASQFLLSDLQDESVYLSVQAFSDGVMNPCLQSTYAFINKVLKSLFAMHMDIYPLRIFHFGGDEVPAESWQVSPICAQFSQRTRISDFKQYMLMKIANMTSFYKLDFAGWEDGVMSENKPMERDMFPNENVYIYAWNNVWERGTMGRAYDFANSGFKVIIGAATNLYLDHPYEPDPLEPGLVWAARYIDTKKVFSTMPENLYMNADTYVNGTNITICKPDDNDLCPLLRIRDNIEGIQGNLFGELLLAQHKTEYMLLPRLLALAERAWHEAPWESETTKERIHRAMEKDWKRFARTLGHKELARLDRQDYNYRIPPPGAIVDENNILKTSVTFPGLVVEITDNGGFNWTVVKEGTEIDPAKKYFLRTSSAFGKRYSRMVPLF